jgi:hypothetical protein
MLDLQAMILRSQRSPSPLRLERPPVPLLARRSSPLERGAAVTNRPEPSLTVSMQVSCNLSMSPRLTAIFTPEDEISMFAPAFPAARLLACAFCPGAPVLASYRPRVLTFDTRTVSQAIPTDTRRPCAHPHLFSRRLASRPCLRFRLRPRFSFVDTRGLTWGRTSIFSLADGLGATAGSQELALLEGRLLS